MMLQLFLKMGERQKQIFKRTEFNKIDFYSKLVDESLLLTGYTDAYERI